MSIHQIKTRQTLNTSMDEAWNFLSDPSNLERITPGSMKMRITSEPSSSVYAGMIITYSVRPLLNIPLPWVSEITQLEEGAYFVDEQRVGPYALWHHEHHIKPVEGGVEMYDVVTYKLPLGFLGRLAHALFVKRKLRSIFNFREERLNAFFNSKTAV